MMIRPTSKKSSTYLLGLHTLFSLTLGHIYCPIQSPYLLVLELLASAGKDIFPSSFDG